MGTPVSRKVRSSLVPGAMSLNIFLVLLGSLLAVFQPVTGANPPDWDQFAMMARYIVHYSDWVGVSTISSRDPIMDYPFANVKTVSDGSSAAVARGIPYFYLSPMDLSSMDIWKNPKASLSFSLADQYCKEQDWIAQDPRCPRLLVTGEIARVDDAEEKEFAQDALFTRYPVMETWPADHGFFFAKLVPESILLLDQFGGAADIDIEEFYGAQTPEEELAEVLFSN